MALEVYFPEDIAQAILAGMVLALETAQTQGFGNPDHVSGILSMAKRQTLSFGISWASIIEQAQAILGTGHSSLLNQAIQGLIEVKLSD